MDEIDIKLPIEELKERGIDAIIDCPEYQAWLRSILSLTEGCEDVASVIKQELEKE